MNARRLVRSLWASWFFLLVSTPYFKYLQLDQLAVAMVGWNTEVQDSFGRSLSEASARSLIVMFILNVIFSYRINKYPPMGDIDSRLINREHLVGFVIVLGNLLFSTIVVVCREYANWSYILETDQFNMDCLRLGNCVTGGRVRTGEHWSNLFGIGYLISAFSVNAYLYRRVLRLDQIHG